MSDYEYRFTLQLVHRDRGPIGRINDTMKDFGFTEKIEVRHNEVDWMQIKSPAALDPEKLEEIRADAEQELNKALKDTIFNAKVGLQSKGQSTDDRLGCLA